jgi:hypothetical protein
MPARAVRGERGQVLPLVLVILLVAAGGLLLLVRLGARATAQARAQLAADSAALAGAADGRAAAEALAAANGAVVEAYTVDGRRVRVVVQLAGARAAAVAERTDGLEGGAYSGADAFGPAWRGDDAGGRPVRAGGG